MRTLYHHPLCPYSRKIRFILNEKKLDYTTKIEPFWEKREEFFELNHAFEVPVLIDISGRKISDSIVIAEYLEELYPHPQLMSDDLIEKSEIRRLSNWFDLIFGSQVSMPLIYEKVFNRYVQKNHTPNTTNIRNARQKMHLHFDYIAYLCERRGFLAGKTLTLADITAASHISVIDFLGSVDWSYSKEVKNWYMRIKSRATFKTFLEDFIPGVDAAKHYKELDF